MTAAAAAIDDITLDIDRDAVAQRDARLAARVAEMPALPGFRDARSITTEEDDGPRARRIVRYCPDSDQLLVEYPVLRGACVAAVASVAVVFAMTAPYLQHFRSGRFIMPGVIHAKRRTM